MTFRPVPTLAAACALSLIALAAPSVRADDPSTAIPSPAWAQFPVDAQASAPALTPARYQHRRHAYPDADSRAYLRAPSLPSRGMTERLTGADSVVGRLAMVVTDQSPIVAGRDRAGRVLSVCAKGQYLDISGETPTQYAVLMVDHSLGFIAKGDVQMLDYQVTAAGGADASADGGGASPLGARMVQVAQTYLGVPYVWGGNTAAGIDCSGFVRAIYAACGIDMPRVSRDQAAIGYDVPHDVASGDWNQWVPGDRMYFACHHPFIDHTAMYIGGGYFIHASAGHGHQVAIDRVDNPYYSAHLVAVRRSPELLAQSPTPGAVTQTASAPDPESGQQ